MPETLAVEQLEVRYGPIAAVRKVTLTCAPGELLALVGPNGAGKSSTLGAIAGGLSGARVRGAVRYGGRDLLGRPAEDVSRAGVVLVPERRRIFGTLTVRENLLLGASAWARREQAEREVERVIERFPALRQDLGRAGGLLSGGQQQQLAIARALMGRPQVLLLDEPSLGLSPQMTDVVFEIIEGLRRDGLSVVLVEQTVVRAVGVADRAVVMRKGRLEESLDSSEAEAMVGAYLGAPQAERGDG